MSTTDEIDNRMDETEKKICKLLKIESKSVNGFVDFFMGTGKAFDFPKYERLFNITQTKKEKQLCASKSLDFSFREKLPGLSSKMGDLKWENTKIDVLLSSLR